MNEFFSKYRGSFQPQEAIEILCQKAQKIREMIYQEDELHLEELRLLSEMIDDYVREVIGSGYKFQKKDYQDMRGKYNPFQMYNTVSPIYGTGQGGGQGGQSTREQGQGYGQQGQPGQQGQQGVQGNQGGGQQGWMPNQEGGNLGYRHWPMIYPMYPFYGNDAGQGGNTNR